MARGGSFLIASTTSSTFLLTIAVDHGVAATSRRTQDLSQLNSRAILDFRRLLDASTRLGGHMAETETAWQVMDCELFDICILTLILQVITRYHTHIDSRKTLRLSRCQR